jgi:type III restriction enzyme
MTDQERDQLSAALATQEGRAAIEEAYRLSKRLVARLRPPTAAERGLPFEVPVLAVRQGDVFEQLEETHLLDHPWSLRDCDASLSEAEYPQATRAGEQGEVYVTERGELRTRFIANLHQQMTWLAGDTHWSVADLVIFLDRTVPHTDIPSDDCALFLTRVVRTLMDQRAFSLAELIREKYRLREAVSALIDKHRADARKRAYQALLAPDCLTPLAVTAECVFRYDPRGYPFGARYEGSYDWCKHYYRNVGEFDSQEELACAQWIDQLDPVEFWVRNIPHREPGSFWLQTSTDRFYPDFVCKLKEGRYLVVEYKGAHLLDTPDTREKRDLGELWERRSTGLCLFVMVTAPDYDPIARKVHSSL